MTQLGKFSVQTALLFQLFAITIFISQSQAESTFYFIKEAATTKAYKVPPPPEAESVEDVKDMNQVRAYQIARTPEDCARASTEENITLEHFYGAPYGPLTAREIKILETFLRHALYDVDLIVHRYKNTYNRLRPYLRDPLIEPCIRREGSKAYPSGHAAIGWFHGRVLSDFFPANKDVLMKRAAQIGDDRVIGGVHHPSDVDAGRKLAEQIYLEIRITAAFKKEMARLQKELKPAEIKQSLFLN